MFAKRILADESGQIILRHIIKIGVVIAIIGLLLWAVGPLIYYRIACIQDAEDFANAIAFDYKLYQNPDKAVYEEGIPKLKLMGYSDEEISQSKVEFLPVGVTPKTSVRVTLLKIASNSLIDKISFLRRYAKIYTTKQISIQAAEKR